LHPVYGQDYQVEYRQDYERILEFTSDDGFFKTTMDRVKDSRNEITSEEANTMNQYLVPYYRDFIISVDRYIEYCTRKYKDGYLTKGYYDDMIMELASFKIYTAGQFALISSELSRIGLSGK
jgi:hypothetical protein